MSVNQVAYKWNVWVTACIAMFLYASCGSEKIPDGVINPKQMPAVLVDIHLVDGQLASLPIDSARMLRDVCYDAVFRRYAIDSAAFRRSVEFYASRPYLMNEMYAGVEKKLNALNQAEQQRVQQKYEAQRKVDSLRNARTADSLQRIARDSIDFKRKRYLLYLDAPDTLYGAPEPVTHELLHDRMLETVGLNRPAGRPRVPAMPPRKPPVAPESSPSIPQKPRLRTLEKIR